MTAAVITLASRTPRCLNCVEWGLFEPDRPGPVRFCNVEDREINSDWHCPEFRRKEGAS